MTKFLTNIDLRSFNGGVGELIRVVEICNREAGFSVIVGRGNHHMPNDAALYSDPTQADHSLFWQVWRRIVK